MVDFRYFRPVLHQKAWVRNLFGGKTLEIGQDSEQSFSEATDMMFFPTLDVAGASNFQTPLAT